MPVPTESKRRAPTRSSPNMRKLKVHINCNPWIEDGKWNLEKVSDYNVLSEEVSESNTEQDIEYRWEDALDDGVIHSYYIQKPEDPEPTFHSVE